MNAYRERLWPAPWLFVSTALVIPASLLVFLPISTTAGIIVAIALYVGCVVALLLSSPAIAVTDDEVVAGRARLPIRFVGEVSGHSGSEAVAERGPRLDARAWLLIRGWVGPVVKIEVADAADPVPYWIVSTRHPERVLAAIEQSKTLLEREA
jgi:hypothetical protein